MELKVGDFGLATKLDFEGEKKRTVCGTPNYIAPEILDGKSGHSYEVDIWSLGVIIYTLIIGKPPFETQDVKTTYKRIKMNAYTFPETAVISEAAKALITEILVTDPLKRPSLDQILTHDFFNQGISIPKLLPSSTLACTPSLSYIRQFMPDVGPNGIVNKPSESTTYSHQKIQSDRPGVDVGKRPMTTTDTYQTGNVNNNLNTMKESDKKMRTDIQLNPVSTVNQTKENLKVPDIWVKKWLDYSSKYGLGYLLSNGHLGVFFNDSSKIILNPTTSEFNYIERRVSDKQEIYSSYLLTDFPKELNKKVTLLQHFKSYLEGDKPESSENKNVNEQAPNQEVKPENTNTPAVQSDQKALNGYVYVKKWMRTRHAIMFRLSNKIVQVCFQDHTEIILSSESRVVTYANKKGERLSYPLSTALESNNYEMTKRLKYTKDILTHMLNMNQQQANKPMAQQGQSTADQPGENK